VEEHESVAQCGETGWLDDGRAGGELQGKEDSKGELIKEKRMPSVELVKRKKSKGKGGGTKKLLGGR